MRIRLIVILYFALITFKIACATSAAEKLWEEGNSFSGSLRFFASFTKKLPILTLSLGFL